MALLDFLNRRNRSTAAEMSFIDHLEELRWHIIRAVVAVLVGAIIVFIYVREIVDKILLARLMIHLLLTNGFAMRVIFFAWEFPVYGRHEGQLYQHRNDGTIYFFFHCCLCWRLYPCISLCFLGILAFCKTCA
jgi:hypothetical protein